MFIESILYALPEDDTVMSMVKAVTKFLHIELGNAEAGVYVGNACLSEHYPFLQISMVGLNKEVDKGQVLVSSAY